MGRMKEIVLRKNFGGKGIGGLLGFSFFGLEFLVFFVHKEKLLCVSLWEEERYSLASVIFLWLLEV